MNWLTKFIRPGIHAFTQRNNVPEDLWMKCTQCEEMLFQKDLPEHLYTCQYCGAHRMWPISQRLEHLFDEGKYTLLSLPEVASDPLNFRDKKRYKDRLKEARQKTGHQDALVSAKGLLGGTPLVVACFDFSFVGGSMGMAVGQGLLYTANYAARMKAPLLIVPSSGGARMQEGVLSLMQMTRSILALHALRKERLPVVVLMTNPTTGGVFASFASLGDVTLAEPGAIIGFAGARVIQETIRQPLPPNFQTSSFQHAHGFVDKVVKRQHLRSTLEDIFALLMHKHRQGSVQENVYGKL